MWFQFLSGKDLALSRVVWLISKPLCHPIIFLQNVVVKSVDPTAIRCSFFTLMLMQHKNWASLERSLLPVEIGQPGQQQSIWLSWTIREKALVMRSPHIISQSPHINSQSFPLSSVGPPTSMVSPSPNQQSVLPHIVSWTLLSMVIPSPHQWSVFPHIFLPTVVHYLRGGTFICK